MLAMIVSIILLLLLVIFNGFFAGSELALVSINNSKIKSMANEGHRAASLVLQLKEIPNKFLSTIQIGVSIASVLSGVFASEAFAGELTRWILTMVDYPEAAVKTMSMFFITLLTSYLMLVFGELVPKRIAMANPEKFAFFVVHPLWFLSKITTPIVKFLSMSTNLVLRLLGIDPDKVDDEVTEEEIKIMVAAGEINFTEKQMIYNIFNFDNIEVSDVMVHRTDVVAVDSDSSFEEIMDLVHEERYTRYPVYEENIDDIIGVIHLRDLLRYIKSNSDEPFDIKKILREPYYVPDSKRTDELFREFQKNKTHMAIVIDEYGGTAGVITMENLIEEIMGNILDEYDEEEEEYPITKISDDEYLVSGSCDIEDLDEILLINMPIEDYETVSGFIIGELGRIPTKEDVINDDSDFIFNGYLFSIEDIDEKVISKIRVSKEKIIEEDEEESD